MPTKPSLPLNLNRTAKPREPSRLTRAQYKESMMIKKNPTEIASDPQPERSLP